jgi:L-lactate dehydrogenase complex protein LldF
LPSRWKELGEVLKDPTMREALERAMARFAHARGEALVGLGDFQEWSRRCRELKEGALGRADDLWTRVREGVEARGGQFYMASHGDEARKYIGEAIQGTGGNLVVKGKSITSEEIYLNPYLMELGLEVVETDLGERIIQLAGEKPSHLIVPAIHKTKREVAHILSQFWDREVPDDPYLITKEVREDLREKFLDASAGITGANVVSADVPAFFLMTNEGNGRLCATLPPVHVIITGWEKIVEDTEDAFTIFDILPVSSAGLRYSSYLSIFTAPFPWKRGRNWHVVVMDNGRREAAKDPILKEALRCIRCGACMNVCPVYKTVGGHTFSKVYMGGIGAAWTAITGDLKEAKEVASLCTGCGTCLEVCPMEIPIPRLVERVKELDHGEGPAESLAVKVLSKRKYLESAAGMVSLFAPKQLDKLPGPASYLTEFRVLETPQVPPFHSWARAQGLQVGKGGEVTLYAGCMVDYFYPQIGREAVELLRALEISIQLMKEECCGIPARVMGEWKQWEKLSVKNIYGIPRDKPILFLCATCLSGFCQYRDRDSGFPPFYDLSQVILDKLGDAPFPGTFEGRVAYHFPCHLERHVGIKEEPLKLLGKVKGVDLVEGEEAHLCCGGAGLYGFKFPPVSGEILKKKLEWLEREKVEVLVTSCPSCIMQLRGGVEKVGLPVRVIHMATFLIEAWGQSEKRND